MSTLRRMLDQLSDPLHRRKLAAIEWIEDEARERDLSISEFVLGKPSNGSARAEGKTPEQAKKVSQVLWLLENYPRTFKGDGDRNFFLDVCHSSRLTPKQEEALDKCLIVRHPLLPVDGE